MRLVAALATLVLVAAPPPPGLPPSAPANAPSAQLHVVVVPLGRAPDADVIEEIRRRLAEVYGATVEVAPREPLPAAAWYPKRRRWRADRLLDHLHGKPAGPVYLGLTAEDVSTTKEPYEDWGVFGLGDWPGTACVVSSFRLAPTAKDRAHLRRRIAVTAVHEVGHTLGLPHCGDPGACVMHDAEGSIANTDATDGTLGPACRAMLQAR